MTDLIKAPDRTITTAVLSELHDSELISIEIQRDQHLLVLGFKLVNNEVRKLRFTNVVGFRVTDVIEQNIVSQVLMFPGYPFSTEQLTHWIKWANSLSDTEPLVTSEALERITGQLQRGELILFVVEPSWGAEVAIICGSVLVQ